MLSNMHDDLIGKYETFKNAKNMWDQLKFDFGSTSTTRLRSLVLKFELYRKDPKDTMTKHLRMMSRMIRDLKVAGNVLIDVDTGGKIYSFSFYFPRYRPPFGECCVCSSIYFPFRDTSYVCVGTCVRVCM